MKMTVRNVEKFEHRTITISGPITAYSTNHLIDNYIYYSILIMRMMISVRLG